jgi:hypothetical protein
MLLSAFFFFIYIIIETRGKEFGNLIFFAQGKGPGRPQNTYIKTWQVHSKDGKDAAFAYLAL